MRQQVTVKDPKTGALQTIYVERGPGRAIPAAQKVRGATPLPSHKAGPSGLFRAEKIA